MQLTNRRIIESRDALSKLNSLKLPVKTSFKIAKISRIINELLKDYTETLKKLQDEYSNKNEDGTIKSTDGMIDLKDPEEFNKIFQELLDIENEVSLPTLKIAHFGDVSVEPSTLYQVDWMITD